MNKGFKSYKGKYNGEEEKRINNNANTELFLAGMNYPFCEKRIKITLKEAHSVNGGTIPIFSSLDFYLVCYLFLCGG